MDSHDPLLHEFASLVQSRRVQEERELDVLRAAFAQMGLDVTEAHALPGGRWTVTVGPAEGESVAPAPAPAPAPAEPAPNGEAESLEGDDPLLAALLDEAFDEDAGLDEREDVAQDSPEQLGEVEGTPGEEASAAEVPEDAGPPVAELAPAVNAEDAVATAEAAAEETGKEEPAEEPSAETDADDILLVELPSFDDEPETADRQEAVQEEDDQSELLEDADPAEASGEAEAEGRDDDVGVVLTPPEPRPSPFRQGSTDPAHRARRLARTLASEMIEYHKADFEAVKNEGPEVIGERFGGQIDLARREYHKQVAEAAVPERDAIFAEAVNEIIGNGQKVLET